MLSGCIKIDANVHFDELMHLSGANRDEKSLLNVLTEYFSTLQNLRLGVIFTKLALVGAKCMRSPNEDFYAPQTKILGRL